MQLSLNPRSLAHTIPELHLREVAADVWVVNYFSMSDLLFDLLVIPNDELKDAGWRKGHYGITTHLVSPARFGAALAAILPLLDHSDDWTPTSVRTFSARIAVKLASASSHVKQAFQLQSADFIDLPNFNASNFSFRISDVHGRGKRRPQERAQGTRCAREKSCVRA